MIKKISLTAVTALFILSGCGNSNKEESFIKVTEISQLEGFWDTSYDKDGKHDEIYEYYLPNGEIVIYDYQKDSFDNGKDCYLIGMSAIEIRQNVAGVFEYYDTKAEKTQLQFDAEISSNELQLVNPFKPDESLSYKRVTKSRSDLEAKQCTQNSSNKIERKNY